MNELACDWRGRVIGTHETPFHRVLKLKLTGGDRTVGYVLLLSIVCYGLSTLGVILDTSFTYRWPLFWLHIVSVASVGVHYIVRSSEPLHGSRGLAIAEIIGCAFIAAVALGSQVIFLGSYPYVNVGDAVRDGGLGGQDIAVGAIVNIFGYGDRESYGLIIPTFTGFFYNIYGSSMMSYTLPSMIVACLEVVALYLAVRGACGRSTAFWAALVLATLPLHVYFGRTEVVVAFSSFWTAVILLAVLLVLRRRRLLDYALLGTILGFASGFHAAARAVALLVLVIMLGREGWALLWQWLHRAARDTPNWTDALRERLSTGALLLLFFAVGFGPRIVFTTPHTFLHAGVAGTFLSRPLSLNALGTIGSRYVTSLKAWYVAPTNFNFPSPTPLLTPVLALFFLLGVGYSLVAARDPFLRIVLALAFLVPLTNSAITDTLNADHRINPLLPIGSIFIGIGLSRVLAAVRYRVAQYGLAVIAIAYLLIQLHGFFSSRVVSSDRGLKDYLAMHIIYVVKSQQPYRATANAPAAGNAAPVNRLCLLVSPANYENLTLLHYREQYRYFLPRFDVQPKARAGLADSEAYIVINGCPRNDRRASRTLTVSCRSGTRLDCPPNYRGVLTIHY